MPAASEPSSLRGPRQMLLNDEGNSALHFVDLDAPSSNWSFRGPGRDLQLIGNHRLLRSSPKGFVELDLAARAAMVRSIDLDNLPGGVESARRLPNGNTVLLGNGGGGIFVWEVDGSGQPVAARSHLFPGIDKARLLRQSAEGTFLFCSETEGKRIIHELRDTAGSGTAELKDLFRIPADVPVDSMVKAVRTAPGMLTVSTGYAASLLRIDLAKGAVTQTIGGKEQPEPSDAKRPLSPFFFSGYQVLANGDLLISNWQGHSAERNGQGYQVLQYRADGQLVWTFDQTQFPYMSSLNNVIALDGLDTGRLHDEPNGILTPVA